ncbi:hypothetical protein Agub_g15294 [Astrephomene gubernaculifera]|uniref:Eukaryotic translation initiation factor 3 subunit F n=1 Tax=Astrephomene gubernaculifera TaxID=47775 RepID=A0AAD3HU39_9CHLO|nr:hypothetical protein Agub_g15294 [Astrephomene gubernaculifera]
MASTVLMPSGSNVSVKVHPVVLFAICDAYTRRKEHQDRVIGTLLGVVVDNVIEVKNCYVVPHNESSEQVMVDVVHHKTMFDLHQKVAPHEAIVGWFATGSELYNSDALIQEFYSKESTHPVHMVVDTTLKDDKFSVQAYTSRTLALGEKALATEFVEIPCDTIYGDIERVGTELMLTGFNDPSPEAKKDTANKSFSEESETLGASMGRLAELVARAAEYVDSVVSGKVAGDPAIGRYLADTLALVPHLARPDFERLFNESVQDAMTATYLSDLLRAHVALAERLGTAACLLQSAHADGGRSNGSDSSTGSGLLTCGWRAGILGLLRGHVFSLRVGCWALGGIGRLLLPYCSRLTTGCPTSVSVECRTAGTWRRVIAVLAVVRCRSLIVAEGSLQKGQEFCRGIVRQRVRGPEGNEGAGMQDVMVMNMPPACANAQCFRCMMSLLPLFFGQLCRGEKAKEGGEPSFSYVRLLGRLAAG